MPAHRARANRNWSALLLEKETRGAIRDGTGLRYRIGPDYVIAGDHDRAERYFSWFDREFPDDAGEPVFLLYKAVERFTCHDIEAASRCLKDAMLSNLYMLPHVIGHPVSRLPIWHGGNWHEPEYLDEVQEFFAPLTLPQREWVRARYGTPSFSALRTRFIRDYTTLLSELDITRRSKVLDDLALYVSTNKSTTTDSDG